MSNGEKPTNELIIFHLTDLSAKVGALGDSMSELAKINAKSEERHIRSLEDVKRAHDRIDKNELQQAADRKEWREEIKVIRSIQDQNKPIMNLMNIITFGALGGLASMWAFKMLSG